MDGGGVDGTEGGDLEAAGGDVRREQGDPTTGDGIRSSAGAAGAFKLLQGEAAGDVWRYREVHGDTWRHTET